MPTKRLATAAFAAAVAASFLLPNAARAQKKALTQADWDIWKSITTPALSNDGNWVVYTIAPQVGDGELVIRSTHGSTEYHVPRGYISRPNNVPGALRPGGGADGAPAGPTISPAQISADSKYVVVSVDPTEAEVEHAPRGRGGAPARESQSMAIVELATGKITTVANVRSFRMPRDNGTWLAYVPAPSDSAGGAEGGANAAGAAGGRGGRGRGGRGGGGGSARRQFGSPLMLRNLATGAEEPLSDVLVYAFDDSAKVLAYTTVSRDSTKDGAFVRNLSSGATSTLLTGNGDYKAVAFDRTGAELLFLSDRDEFGQPKPRYALYEAPAKGGAAQKLVDPSMVPAGLHIADNGAIAFTRTGSAITLNIAPPPVDSVPADSLVGKAEFDLWNYKDPTLQPAQKLSAARDRNKSYEAVYFLGSRKLVRLADDTLTNVALSEDGRIGLSNSRVRYLISSMWGDNGTDVYVVDAAAGTRKLIKAKISGNAQLSPDAKYVAYFDHGHWYSYSTSSGRTVDLTGPVAGVSFEQETYDNPETPPTWGLAGWTKDDKSVLIYDRYDLWELDPTGAKPARMVTDSVGRKNDIQFRLAEGGGRGGRGGGGGRGGAANDDRGVIDPAETTMLRATNLETMASGFYQLRLDDHRAPEKIVMDDVAYGTPVKAAHADEYLLTKSTVEEFPDLWVGPSLTKLTKVSDANPQQKDYNWGTVELVHWMSADGVPLKGLLYKPENFDPHKKYPMIAYFYESLSNNLHQYVAPNGRNTINPIHYVSNGYLVFEPDIHYETGYPGPSAVKSIVPGVESLIARGFVDEKHLGIQGQSWGGYQTAFIITQTHLFAAAMAGAPVVDMFSAYGGIRWGSGLARAFQYETGQSRIGKSIWDAPMQYMENSPLFWLDKVTTPLFIMTNDADQDVPWYQGIEFFVAMRRLGKEIYMISYNNELHNPVSRANQKDIARRMQEFFDNKLKGGPEPDWMIHGIPYIDKGRDQLAPMPVQAGVPQPDKP